MFCTNCGSNNKEYESFCTNCGKETNSVNKNEHWWMRLGVLLYIVLHLPLLVVVPAIWSDNILMYNPVTETNNAAVGWTTLVITLTILFWLLGARLIKMVVRYLFVGVKPRLTDLLNF